MVLRVALGETGHCLCSSPGAPHHTQIITSTWRQERMSAMTSLIISSLCRGTTPGRPFNTSFRNSFICTVPKAPRQAVAVACRAGSAHQRCHGGSALVLDVCALSAGPVRCCWSRTVVTCQGLTALRPFPCSVLSQFCSSPINSSTPFMWKGRVSLLPLWRLFQDSVSGVTWQLWRMALNLYAVSKDSSGFGLQLSQCLQNFTVKERDTVHLVILLISLPAFLID